MSQDEPTQGEGNVKTDGEAEGSAPVPETDVRDAKASAGSVERPDAKADDAASAVKSDPPPSDPSPSDPSPSDPSPRDDAAKSDEETAGAETADGEATDESETQRETRAPKRKPETWTNTLLWAAGILVLLGIELFFYGHDGYIQVCVGIDQITKFEIRHQVKSKANAKHHPFCAERLNLGMWSSSEEHSKAALQEACHSAARVVGMERKQHCLRNDDPWKRFVDKQHVMPWDPRFYRRLLWLE